MPKRNRYASNEANSKKIEEIVDDKQRRLIKDAIRATEAFAQLSCISLGLLQMLALSFAKKAVQFRWLRTRSNAVPSEATIADYLKKSYFVDFERISHLPITQYIAKAQEWLDEGIEGDWKDFAA